MIPETIIKQFVLDNQMRLEIESLKKYQCAILQFLQFAEKPLSEIEKSDIRSWLAHLKEKEYQPSTLWSKVTALKTFFKYCFEESLIEKNPAYHIPFPKIEEKIPYYLSVEQVNKLRKLLEGRLQERAMLEVLYATGVRISEMCAIKREDIDWSERTIFIPKGKGKKDRIVLFTHLCAEHLKAYLDSRTDDLPYVFLSLRKKDQAIHPDTVGQWLFKKYSQALEFKLTPHTLRHTFTAHLAQKGMPLECLQALLGHEDPKHTHYYARLYNQARKEIYDQLM